MYDEISARLRATELPAARRTSNGSASTFLATTEGALDRLESHTRLRESGWTGRVVPTFRPDDVVDPDRAGFHAHVVELGEL